MRLGDLWAKRHSGTMQPDSADVTVIREIAATL
jgi:hypothetical protein